MFSHVDATDVCVYVYVHVHCKRRRKQFERGGHMASAEREPIRGLGAEPPAGFRGRAPGQGAEAYNTKFVKRHVAVASEAQNLKGF